jgi:hypothetical protein
MKTIRFWTALILAVGSTAGVAAARDKGAKVDEPVVGVLQRVAVTDREVVVIGPGADGPETETTIAVPAAAKVYKGGKAVEFVDLREGDQATIQVERREGRLSALEVRVGPPVVAERPRRPVIARVRRALRLAEEILKRVDPEPGQPQPRP